ncbi:uncharacterized protein LOC110033227 isoform X2 [Phalaenopsis equestris]|uniref:uncharacterized protein LOC110033227 isoform X2 n=1 Tax=Phalaenopsis equestris TaxID=78828 RepID=UPI0009E30398|nr:uncharacterized protein LOC110033227 isoform X2 [Phalaenopsis equestris]
MVEFLLTSGANLINYYLICIPKSFGHNYFPRPDCPTHAAGVIGAANQNRPNPFIREGISGLEFDSKGIYVASVTKSGCLTVLDFETLYCSVYGPYSSLCEDKTKCVLHICTSRPLDAVRWNPANQDEICCVSRSNNMVHLYDIGYVSTDPIEVLEKGKLKFSLPEAFNGLSDIAFASADKSRLLASGLDGAIYIWDRRLSNLPCQRLNSSFQSPLNSIELDIEDRIIFGANQQGIICAWDLRGGRSSFAFQSHKEDCCPLLTSLKVSSMLEKISALKEQSNILPKEIHSIKLDPSCSYQLAFHLDDGWSGVLNLNNLNVTHVHCPPPPWLDGIDKPVAPCLRRPTWLDSNSVYAVGSSSVNGVYLLDFFPDGSSACNVDNSDAPNSVSVVSKGVGRNRFIPVSDTVLACAVHPQNGTIIAGSKQSSLLMISRTHQTNDEGQPHESC